MRKILVAAWGASLVMLFSSSAVAAPVHHHGHPPKATAARVARLKARVAADMPDAVAEVNAAKAAGPEALKALVQRVNDMPLAAPETTTPEQYALTQALKPEATVEDQSGVTRPDGTAQIASSCWYVGSHIWNSTLYFEAGVQVAHAEKDHGFWCGNGYSITDLGGSNYGYYHKIWSNGPFCTVTVFNVNNWDGPHASWAHGGLTTHMGTYTPWTTCVTYQGGSDIVRIAANGHWDTYWDF